MSVLSVSVPVAVAAVLLLTAARPLQAAATPEVFVRMAGCWEEVGRAPAEGVYANLAEHHAGRYTLQHTGSACVRATLATARSPVQHWARQQPQPLFTLPPEFRPPFPVIRQATGQPVLSDGTPDPARPGTVRFRLQAEPDGTVRYLDDSGLDGVSYLAYALTTLWGTTPAANDHAVVGILKATWPDQMWLHPVGRIYLDSAERVTGLHLRGDTLALWWSEGTEEIPPELGQLAQLQWLDLSYNQLTGKIPPELGQLAQLQRLDLSYNQLTGKIPPELGQLAQLQRLSLYYNRLTALPPELGQLGQLQNLDLSHNQLIALPPKLGQLGQLQNLDLSHNQLMALPPELDQLQRLEFLFLSHNRLTTLPPELSQLQRLDLSHNQLTALPSDLAQLAQLQRLDLSHNQLTALPPELAQLAQLQQLDLSHNQLTALPPELSQLQRLEFLFLSHNRLTEISPALAQGSRLRYLHLGHNRLTALPPELSQLARSTKLVLNDSRLTILPLELTQRKPVAVYLEGNPLTGCLPADWRGQKIRIYQTKTAGPLLLAPVPFCAN